MILGTIEHIFFRWHLMGRKEELADFVDPMIEILIQGIKEKEDAKPVQIFINMADGEVRAAGEPASGKAKQGRKTPGSLPEKNIT